MRKGTAPEERGPVLLDVDSRKGKTMNFVHRHLATATLAAGMLLGLGTIGAAADPAAMAVYKDPMCGCCEAWADAMKAAGFKVQIHNEDNMTPIKSRYGVPADMEGCHTAVVDGYVIEGHVPLQAVTKLLAERPNIAGIATPGMPAGSLGMGDDPNASYDVYALTKQPGEAPSVYYSVRPQ